MANTDDLRKTFTDPTPLYFVAGTADNAVQQAKKVPALIDQLRTEVPSRIESVRNTDPKVVQDKVVSQAKEAQAKVTEVLGSIDTDLKKLGESAQDIALRGVGYAAEAAVKMRETYERVAEHGEQTVKTWRGEVAEEINEIAVAVEPAPETETGTAAEAEADKELGTGTEAKSTDSGAAPAKKATPRKSTAKKATPAAEK
ncbi:hypothetical protein [Streptomyces sp. H27-C3]|uniref:hypothetical protein n=1 Tax=Streptomyces sp. H27-C3 TaxID=3046305 RepID=UPI0024BBCBEA|nr:hypothetical protein [Streptomyces sp. H27-C3]MDJ0466321.1 hypothetical protein [Streptomyces sp. H27-C3]